MSMNQTNSRGLLDLPNELQIQIVGRCVVPYDIYMAQTMRAVRPRTTTTTTTIWGGRARQNIALLLVCRQFYMLVHPRVFTGRMVFVLDLWLTTVVNHAAVHWVWPRVRRVECRRSCNVLLGMVQQNVFPALRRVELTFVRGSLDLAGFDERASGSAQGDALIRGDARAVLNVVFPGQVFAPTLTVVLWIEYESSAGNAAAMAGVGLWTRFVVGVDMTSAGLEIVERTVLA